MLSTSRHRRVRDQKKMILKTLQYKLTAAPGVIWGLQYGAEESIFLQ
jgi:hypothetical protein